MQSSSNKKDNKMPHTVMMSARRRSTYKLVLQQLDFCLGYQKHICAIRNSCVLFFTFLAPVFPSARAALWALALCSVAYASGDPEPLH